MNETTELIMKQLNQKKTHAVTHELGGGDEIDALLLKNIGSVPVSNEQIADDAVTTSKIADLAVTREKIAQHAVSAEQIDPDLITYVDNVAVQMELDRIDADIVVVGQRKIYARDYGVKLDGVTDDTAALNSFFSHFGEGELIVDNGVALVTGQLKIPGVWRPDTGNSSVKRLTFVRASIKYMGLANKAVMQFYNHFMSVIDGVAITRDSNPTYINFAGVWYSKFLNFESHKITFGYNNSEIGETLLSSANFTNVIEKGYLFGGGMEFYGTGVSGSSVMNSLRVNDVLFDGRSTSAYNIKFYGVGFQNFVFNGCDISYATTALVYIDVTQTTGCSLHFNNCYFDTGVPLLPAYDFKSATITVNQSEESGGNTNQFSFYKTLNMMSGEKRANRGYEPNVLPKGTYNYMFNGDLSLNVASGSWVTVLNAPTTTWKTNVNTLSGNALNVVFNANSQQFIFSGTTVPQTGVYTCGLRIIKNSGDSILQISYNGITYSFDLNKIPNGTEVVLSSHANFTPLTQGATARFSIVTQTINTGLNIDILEVFLIEGTYNGINLPLHPKSRIYNSITTVQRPTLPTVGQSVYDSTLNKPIWCKTSGNFERDTLNVTGAATSSGNITITLNGVGTTVAVSAGDSTGTIGDKIRATTFTGWTVTGTAGSITVVFTKNIIGTNTGPSFSDTGATGTTATIVVSTAGSSNVWVDATGATV